MYYFFLCECSGWAYLVRVLQWAKMYGLQALVDLHGARLLFFGFLFV